MGSIHGESASSGSVRGRPRQRGSTIQSKQSTRSLSAGFQRLRLRPELEQSLIDAGFTEPRPIQTEAIPHCLEGRDVLGLAQTGTGKTAAFVLPVLQQLLRKGPPGVRALVITPTRELADQVQSEFQRLGTHTRLRSIAVFGGVSIPAQERALRKRPEIVVACPGRLLDLLARGAVRLDTVEVLVLDEADHMFDMGFLPDLRRILAALPARRQNLMFSATMPKEVRKLADKVLRNPAVVELEHSRPAETIEHALYPMPEGDKPGSLRKLLGSKDFRSAILFLRTKRRAKQLAQRLEQDGYRAVALQGNMSQGQRTRAIQGFRDGSFDILVATDIAARGIDIEGVSHVVNYDVPDTPAAYTHRIGRTGRSGLTGAAFTFVTADDHKNVRDIQKLLGKTIESRTLDGRLIPERDTRSPAGEGRHPKQGRGANAAQGNPRSNRRGQRPGGSQPASRNNRGQASSGTDNRRSAPPKQDRRDEAHQPFGAIPDDRSSARPSRSRSNSPQAEQQSSSRFERRSRVLGSEEHETKKPFSKPYRKRATRGRSTGGSSASGGSGGGGGGNSGNRQTGGGRGRASRGRR